MTTSFERPSRREVLKQSLLCATALAVPLSLYSRSAHALTKAGMNYTDNGPGTGQNAGYCVNCKSFVPGATPDAPGTCLVVTDGPISPKGHCDGWSKKVHAAPER